MFLPTKFKNESSIYINKLFKTEISKWKELRLELIFIPPYLHGRYTSITKGEIIVIIDRITINPLGKDSLFEETI